MYKNVSHRILRVAPPAPPKIVVSFQKLKASVGVLPFKQGRWFKLHLRRLALRMMLWFNVIYDLTGLKARLAIGSRENNVSSSRGLGANDLTAEACKNNLPPD